MYVYVRRPTYMYKPPIHVGLYMFPYTVADPGGGGLRSTLGGLKYI